MPASKPIKITVFFILSWIALFDLIISFIVMINQLGMDQRLQGWVNLLWLPLPVLTLIIDRLCIRKFGTKNVNKIELYILALLTLLIIINLIRLQV